MLDPWRAQLRLSFARDGERSVLCERVHEGPLRVQRPFYPEGQRVCHVYVLHPPGGVVGGDRLSIEVHAKPLAHPLLTTPAAGKLYRSQGQLASQLQTLQAGRGACLEWLPQETIAFDGARAELTTRVELADDARYIGWDLLCLGRPAAGERFSRGYVAQSLELVRAGRLLYVERGVYDGGAAVLSAPWGLAGWPVVGTFVCVAPNAAAWIEAARAVALPQQGLAAVSGWDDLLIARYLGPSAERGREYFAGLWWVLRPALLGQPACPPRIWRT